MEKVFEIVKIKQVVTESESFKGVTIRSPLDVAQFIQNEIGDEDREVFFVVCLNVKNRVVAVHRASVGSLNSAVIHPREVFKAAILNNAARIIISHNHPSEILSPSPEDIQVTERLVEAGLILGIEVLDHLIIGETKFVSLKEKGYL